MVCNSNIGGLRLLSQDDPSRTCLVQSQSYKETGPGTKITSVIADLLDCPAVHPLLYNG